MVGICYHGLHLLDAVDGYAFLGIGNLTARDVSQSTGSNPKMAVVLIDQESHENFYRERSPLDRCELKKDLEAIYNLPGPPKPVVIDLDLSPSLEVLPPYSRQNTAARKCMVKLKALLKQYRKTETM